MFIFVFWVLLEIFLPRTKGYPGCWLAGKTRGRKESCYGDLRPLNDALARAAGRVHHLAQNVFLLGEQHLTPTSLLKAVFSLLFYNVVLK